MYSQLAAAAVVVCIVFPLLASLMVVLRIYAQSVKTKGLRADDCFIVAGLVRNQRNAFPRISDLCP